MPGMHLFPDCSAAVLQAGQRVSANRSGFMDRRAAMRVQE